MPQIQIAQKLLPLLTTPKRTKIAVGGRGGSKSVAFADVVVKRCDDGARICCAREFQNQIDESVHPLIKSRIDHLGAMCSYDKTSVISRQGGEIFYRGLSRNPTGIQSMFGVKLMWIEEGQALSEATLDALSPTIREPDSEIWISMNRGSSKDPISQRYLAPYEREIAKYGFYEDDDILIIEINGSTSHQRMVGPGMSGFLPTSLRRQRARSEGGSYPEALLSLTRGSALLAV